MSARSNPTHPSCTLVSQYCQPSLNLFFRGDRQTQGPVSPLTSTSALNATYSDLPLTHTAHLSPSFTDKNETDKITARHPKLSINLKVNITVQLWSPFELFIQQNAVHHTWR